MLPEDTDSFILQALKVIFYDITKYTGISDDVFDSAKVTEEVIRNSFTLVGQIITTEKIIYNIRNTRFL